MFPGFIERNRPEKPVTQLTIGQLQAELRRFPARGLTPQMERRVAVLRRELAGRSKDSRKATR